MEWLRTHPYASALGAAGLLIIAGVFIVVTKSAVAPAPSQTIAWGGAGAVLNPSYSPDNATAQGPTGIMQQVQNGAPYTYILPAPQPVHTDTGEVTGDGFDFDAFISMLSNPQTGGSGGAGTSGGASDSSVNSAYAFIPSGLVSVTEPSARTKLQDALYNYGNDVGSFVQSFEQGHPNETQVLTDQAQDRADPGKASAVQTLGDALSSLGDAMLAIDSVPSQASNAHGALAQSYKDIGQKLARVPQTKSDADFIAAVQAYNSSADTFTQHYIALANLFVAYGVTFSQNDPGNVFTFTNASF